MRTGSLNSSRLTVSSAESSSSSTLTSTRTHARTSSSNTRIRGMGTGLRRGATTHPVGSECRRWKPLNALVTRPHFGSRRGSSCSRPRPYARTRSRIRRGRRTPTAACPRAACPMAACPTAATKACGCWGRPIRETVRFRSRRGAATRRRDRCALRRRSRRRPSGAAAACQVDRRVLCSRPPTRAKAPHPRLSTGGAGPTRWAE